MAQQRKSTPAKELVDRARAPQQSSCRLVTEIPTVTSIDSSSGSSPHKESSKQTEENNDESRAKVSGRKSLKNLDDNIMQMNLLSANSIHDQTQTAATTSVKQRMQAANHQSPLHQEASIRHHHHQIGDHDAAATVTNQIVAPISGSGSGSGSNRSDASDQRLLLFSTKDSSPTINMNTRIRPHKNICRFHQQQQQESKRPVLCNNHHRQQQQQHQHQQQQQQQHSLAAHQIPTLVNHNHNHHHNQHHQPTHEQQHSSQSHHQTHCVYHPAHSSHQQNNNQLLNAQRNHDCLGGSESQQNSNYLKRHNNGQIPFVVVNDTKQERRDCNHHHNNHSHHRSEDDDDESRRRRRRRATNLVNNGQDLAEVIVHQQQQQQQQHQNESQQPLSKRTTMRFISQLYFLIHLSAILSLLLHHKNLVTNETWRLQQQQQQPTILTQDQESRSRFDPSPSIHHVAKRRHQQSNNNNNQNETITNHQMPSHINQLPIPLMLSLPPIHPHPSGTISAFLPVPFFEEETSNFSPSSQFQSPNIASQHYRHQQHQLQQQQGRARRTTLPQMLHTPGSIVGGDILVRLFGYRHARWALHYFLVYLLCSSIAMLVSLRLFSSNENRSRDCCICNSAVASSLSSDRLKTKKTNKKKKNIKLGTSELYTGDLGANNLRSPTTTTTFSGFYYRTRLDCTPVLVGSISLGLIQLIVIGLDIAAKVDWFSSPKSSISSNREGSTNNSNSYVSRWPNYLPFLQFAFVSLLMQYILSKVAKNNDQVAAKNSSELHKTALKHLANSRIPINGQQAQGTSFSQIENNKKSILLLHQAVESKASRLITRQHQKHQHHHQNENQMFENNGKRRRISGLQNIALAHLLVTHILLWLMKLNSISLFQAIEPLATSTSPSIYSYSSISPNNSQSRSLITPPIQKQQPNNNNINLINLEFQDPKLATEISDEERTNRSKQLLATTSTSSPEREFNRTERERILRTVKTPTPTSSVNPTLLMATVNSIRTNNPLNENSSTIQQVADNKHQQIQAVDGQFRWPLISDQARSETIVGNSTHQRASLANGHNELKSERGLRSAALMERPVDVIFPAINDSILISKAQLANLMELATKNVQRFQVPPSLTTPSNPTTPTTQTTSTTSTAATTTTTTATPTSTPITPIATSSTTTLRPQFKSSLPKRMTAFRQIQKPTVMTASRTNPSSAYPIRTTSTTTMPTTTTTTTTTGSPGTTTRVPLDVTKIISLAPQGAKKQPVRIHVQRNENNNELATAGISSGGDDSDSNLDSDADSVAADYSIRKPQTTDTKNRQSDYDETLSGEPYRGKAQTYSSTKRPFPSVESDDPSPPRGQHIIYTDAEEQPSPETRHTILETREQNLEQNNGMTTEMIPSRDNISSYDDDDTEDSTGEELDLDSLLPPVPNYTINETSNNEPQDESNRVNSVVEVAAKTTSTKQTANINVTIPKLNSQILGRPRREAPLDMIMMTTNERVQSISSDHDLTAEQSANDEQTKRQPTFSDYLLPIIYQYHILIIAILFNMWLDSLRSTDGPTQLPVEQNQLFERSSRGRGRRRLTNSSSLSDDSNEMSSPISRRHHNKRRSRSVESSDLISADHRTIHHRRRHRTNDLMSEETSSTLSRSNSLRASSERLLWVDRSGKQHRARRHHDEYSASFGRESISRSSSRHRHHHHHHLRSSIIMQREQETPASSACSVFSGLLVVSAALIVIMLGVELLTLLNQCLTQLLSILICLVGLCLVWRSQARQRNRRRRADELLSSASRHRRHLNAADGRKLLLSRKGAAYLTNPNDIVLSAPGNCHHKSSSSSQQQQHQHIVQDGDSQTQTMVINQEIIPAMMPTATSNHRQCFHYLFLLAAYFCGVSIALNLGKQHSVQQLFPPHIMQFLQRYWLHATSSRFNPQASSLAPTSYATTTTTNQGESIISNTSMFSNWGLFWSPLNSAGGEQLFPPMILFHLVLASKGLLLILQVTLQTILIRSSCSQRATRKLRQVYTFLMFSNLSLWAMDICEQQQHLQRQDSSLLAAQHVGELSTTTMDGLVVDRTQLITLEGFTQFACSIVTLSHLYHGLVFMQH